MTAERVEDEELVERLRELLKGATARPWTAFDRDGVRAVMKGNEPPLKANGYHSRQWPEIVAWSGFDSSDVPERYRSANLHLIVGAVNALPDLLTRIEELRNRVERLTTALVDARSTFRNLSQASNAASPDNFAGKQLSGFWLQKAKQDASKGALGISCILGELGLEPDGAALTGEHNG